MSPQTARILYAAILLLHGLGHFGALAGSLWHHRRHTRGDWLSDRSWLLPRVSPIRSIWLSGAFWVLALLGFVAASAAFWFGWLSLAAWASLAVASAAISLIGIFLFMGSWPIFNTLAAMAVNVFVIVATLWNHWPPQDLFGFPG